MNYSLEIEIDKACDEVVKLFDNPDNLKKWMIGLISFEPISGTPGQPGAKSRLTYRMGKREIEMIETITERNLPEIFSGTYETKGMISIVKNRFEALPDNRTKYISEQELQFEGFMKLIAFAMPGSFKKQSMKYLMAFKNFAETGQV